MFYCLTSTTTLACVTGSIHLMKLLIFSQMKCHRMSEVKKKKHVEDKTQKCIIKNTKCVAKKLL